MMAESGHKRTHALQHDLVCAGERRRGKIEAEHFSGLEV